MLLLLRWTPSALELLKAIGEQVSLDLGLPTAEPTTPKKAARRQRKRSAPADQLNLFGAPVLSAGLGDPSRGGKLVKKTITTSSGHVQTYWVRPPEPTPQPRHEEEGQPPPEPADTDAPADEGPTPPPQPEPVPTAGPIDSANDLWSAKPGTVVAYPDGKRYRRDGDMWRQVGFDGQSVGKPLATLTFVRGQMSYDPGGSLVGDEIAAANEAHGAGDPMPRIELADRARAHFEAEHGEGAFDRAIIRHSGGGLGSAPYILGADGAKHGAVTIGAAYLHHLRDGHPHRDAMREALAQLSGHARTDTTPAWRHDPDIKTRAIARRALLKAQMKKVAHMSHKQATQIAEKIGGGTTRVLHQTLGGRYLVTDKHGRFMTPVEARGHGWTAPRVGITAGRRKSTTTPAPKPEPKRAAPDELTEAEFEQRRENARRQRKPEAAAPPARQNLLQQWVDTSNALMEGNATPEHTLEVFDALVTHADAIKQIVAKADSGKRRTKKQLLGILSRWGSQMAAYQHKTSKNAEIIDAIHDAMLERLHVGGGYSWSPFSETKASALRRAIAATTAADIERHQQAVADARERREQAAAAERKATSNPETLAEYRRFVHSHGRDKLSPERRARYDHLEAAESRAKRHAERAATSPRIAVTSSASGTTSIKTSSKRDGTPTWVVTRADRVERDEYLRQKALARTMGGWWSRWDRGFAFKSEADAQRFQASLDGKTEPQEAVQASIEQRAAEKRQALGPAARHRRPPARPRRRRAQRRPQDQHPPPRPHGRRYRVGRPRRPADRRHGPRDRRPHRDRRGPAPGGRAHQVPRGDARAGAAHREGRPHPSRRDRALRGATRQLRRRPVARGRAGQAARSPRR